MHMSLFFCDLHISHVFKLVIGYHQIAPRHIKNKFMVFHPFQKDITGMIPNLFINGVETESTNSFNFLGIMLDENIAPKPHIATLANKLQKYIGIIFYQIDKLFTGLHSKHAVLQFSKFTSYLWNTNMGYEYHRLEKNQKHVIRIITVNKYNAHTEPLCIAFDLLWIKDMLNVSTLKFNRYVHGNLPTYSNSFRIVTQEIHHKYDTRNRDGIHIDRTRTRHASQ